MREERAKRSLLLAQPFEAANVLEVHDEMEGTGSSINKVWHWTLKTVTKPRSDSLDAAEQGRATTVENESIPAHDERTPLLSTKAIPSDPSDTTHNKSRWNSLHLPHLNLIQLTYGTLFAPVYAVLALLPLLPFWIFAAFLVYLVGTTASESFWMYCGCLAVLLPFNLIGTAVIVRRVWMDLYGEGDGGP
ncbi:uncharacterized protein LTR77_002650 [Saxophila tyrrhenica]|uniref:Uncharacterized protein n=1 Tax=Saxophila tyrrhenica TaxID=1690608 RepID=A0AAV9PJN9_9PEZI|nr:hypothetical protein LTR77_002650 [Saxophila tyrrhenica]